MMLLVLLAVTANFATAANFRHGENEEARGGYAKREDIQKTVLNLIRNELSLDNAQFEAFAPVYGEYRKALRSGESRGVRFNPDTATDEQVLEILNRNLDRQIRIATVRKEFIPKFCTVLSVRQTAKLYRIDNSLAKRAHEQLNKRDSLRKSGHGAMRPNCGAPHAHAHRPAPAAAAASAK